MHELQLKELPDGADFATLFDPCENYRYFEGGEEHPFRPDATRFELINASVMADLALLSYLKDEGQIKRNLERGGLRFAGLFDGGEGRESFWKGGTQCFVAHDPSRDFAVVAFRGTEVSEIRDILH